MKSRVLWAEEPEQDNNGKAPLSPVDTLLRTSLPSGILTKILSPPPPVPPPPPFLSAVTPRKDEEDEGSVPSPIATDESVTIDIEMEATSGVGFTERKEDKAPTQVDFLSPSATTNQWLNTLPRSSGNGNQPPLSATLKQVSTPPRGSGSKPPLSPYSTGPSKKVLKAQKKKERKYNQYLQKHSRVITPEAGAQKQLK